MRDLEFLTDHVTFKLPSQVYYQTSPKYEDKITQSIRTQYCSLKNLGWFATLKKNGPIYGVQKIESGFIFVIQKGKRQLSLFTFKMQIASKFQTLKKY